MDSNVVTSIFIILYIMRNVCFLFISFVNWNVISFHSLFFFNCISHTIILLEWTYTLLTFRLVTCSGCKGSNQEIITMEMSMLHGTYWHMNVSFPTNKQKTAHSFLYNKNMWGCMVLCLTLTPLHSLQNISMKLYSLDSWMMVQFSHTWGECFSTWVMFIF